MPATPPEIVVDTARLLEVAAQLASVPAVAVDTEFVRRTTFFAKPGLLQLSAGDGDFLVDLVAMPDIPSLRNFFLDAAPLKVMHSCSEDLEVLKRLFGAVPGSLFDTQVAAAMLGHPLQLSYQRLVKAILDIDVPKDETQSDWLARPLSAAQIEYAALDVRVLLPVQQKLAAELEARGRLAWLEEDCARLLREASREVQAADYFRSMGSAWRLPRRALPLLTALVRWREETARTIDKPRSHVMPDPVLVMIAQRRPQALHELRAIPDLHPMSLRKHGDAALRIVRDTVVDDAAMDAVVPPAPPLPREAKATLSALREMAAGVAQKLGVEVEVLARRRHLEALVESARRGEPVLPEALLGWRREIVGEALLAKVRDSLDVIRGWPDEGAARD